MLAKIRSAFPGTIDGASKPHLLELQDRLKEALEPDLSRRAVLGLRAIDQSNY